MDRNMRAAVFSPIRNKSFEDHKQSDELPACNISKFLKGPAAFKENLEKNLAGVTSRKSKKTSSSGIENKGRDKASQNKTKDASKNLPTKRRDIFALSPECNDTMFLEPSVENSNEHLECSSNSDIIIKSKDSQQKSGKHDQDKGSFSNSSDTILTTNLTKRNGKDVSSKNFVTVRNDKRLSQQSDSKHNNGKNKNLLMDSDKNDKPDPETLISLSSSKDIDKMIANSSKDDKNNHVLDMDCSSQLQAAISLLQRLAQKSNFEEKKQTSTIVSEKIDSKNKKEDGEVSSSNQRHQPSQIQSTIIEKLINNSISYQFDGIRQQLYLQHASLCRTMNARLVEIENQHAASNESLLKIIQELLEENRQLRNAILAHQ